MDDLTVGQLGEVQLCDHLGGHWLRRCVHDECSHCHGVYGSSGDSSRRRRSFRPDDVVRGGLVAVGVLPRGQP
eukprot:12908901-Prorocentrum_lima.AAC.1